MAFYDVVDQVIELLRQRGRLSYRALKRQLELDDASLEDLKYEVIEVQERAVGHDGSMLVWRARGESRAPSADEAPAAVTGDPRGAERAPGADALEAERRQLSVLFCDLVGSTALSGMLDPEELRDVLRAYQTECAAVVERYGGVIARQVGDGLLVNFAYPQVHEDDAGRAARAGLAIIAALPGLNARLGRQVAALREQPLRVRIGVHTGRVVVGALGDSTYRDPMAVVWETPNIAARLQGLAGPDMVVVSGATHRLLGNAFVCEDLGLHEVKGVTTPVMAYHVMTERELRAPLALEHAARRTPLVGRDQEIGVLQDRWEQAKEGMGQLVLLGGEAGIGKSRLVQEMKEHVAEDQRVHLEGRGSPYHQQSAFYPIIDLLQHGLGFDKGDSAEVKLGKLRSTVAHYRLSERETIPFLAPLLGLTTEAASVTVTPQRQRRQTLEALVNVVLQLAVGQPVLMIIEDLHWADPSTLEWMELMTEQLPTARVLLLLTARPEFRVPWGSRAHVTRLTLTRLRRAQVERLMAAVSGGKALPAEVVAQVAEKTDGVPLFVEELTKMVLESAWVREGAEQYELAGPLPPLAIPATLQDSLMARLDRLATTKVVVQLGATLGRTFTYELLKAVAGLDEATLTQELGRLAGAELLYQRGLPPDATYTFKHAMIQDTAYETLLKSTRQQYHQRIAQVLEAQFPDLVGAHHELLAHHYTEAGFGAQALPYWQRAGLRAMERSANVEAIAHLTRGLAVAEALPEGPERVLQELDLLTIVAPVLMATKGYAAPEVEAAYGRARELCRQVGETPRLIRVLLGLGTFHFIRGELETAHQVGAQCLPLVEGLQGLPRRQAHLGLGTALFHLGEFPAAQAHLEEGMASADPQQQRSRPILVVADPRVVCLSYAAWMLWLLGYPDRALARVSEALALSEEMAHPHSLATATALMAWIHHFRGEAQAAQERAEAAISLSREQGFPLWTGLATIVRGWALAQQAQAAEGIAELGKGVAAWRATGAELSTPNYLAMLAESYAAVGQVDDGMRLLSEALATAQKTRERWGEAELYRVKGVLLSMGSPDAQAEADACFQQALDLARRQDAKSLELRAAVSASRLWQRQGRREAAQQVLAPVCQGFTEGFETSDVKGAKALLEALA